MTDENRKRTDLSKIWVISELYYPEETSTGYYMTRIAEGLAGPVPVSVICGQPNYSQRGRTAPRFEVHNGVEIHRAAGTRLDKNVILFRVINMITLGVSVFFIALRRLRPGDRVLVVTTPPSMPFVAAMASLFSGAAYTLLIHDNYPEILIAAKKTQADSLLVKINHFLNRWLYKHASRIIVVGRDMQELLQRKTAGLDVPITVIQNWGENDDVTPAPRPSNKLLNELGLSDKFIFLYAGNMGHPNDMESIVAAAELLGPSEPDIHFLFLGAGVKRKWLENVVRKQKIRNITLLEPRPRAEQQVFLNACDVAIVSLVSQMWGVSMPSRTYNALAAGKPLLGLTEDGSEIVRTIEDNHVGWWVPPDDPELLAEKIREILRRAYELPAMSARARATAEKRFALNTALDRYRKLFW